MRGAGPRQTARRRRPRTLRRRRAVARASVAAARRAALPGRAERTDRRAARAAEVAAQAAAVAAEEEVEEGGGLVERELRSAARERDLGRLPRRCVRLRQVEHVVQRREGRHRGLRRRGGRRGRGGRRRRREWRRRGGWRWRLRRRRCRREDPAQRHDALRSDCGLRSGRRRRRGAGRGGRGARLWRVDRGDLLVHVRPGAERLHRGPRRRARGKLPAPLHTDTRDRFFAQGLIPQRDGSFRPPLGFPPAVEHVRLNRRAEGDDLVGIHLQRGGLREEVLHATLDQRHPRGAADHDDAVDVPDLQVDRLDREAAHVEGAIDHPLGLALELLARHLERDRDRLSPLAHADVEDVDARLGFGGELLLQLLRVDSETRELGHVDARIEAVRADDLVRHDVGDDEIDVVPAEGRVAGRGEDLEDVARTDRGA